ncbi:N-acetyltransferase [Lysinibacillus alkalisoli]|uniref:Aminoglycoside N(6')-acetyltransferase type 1 n=1 Tax=Lysinibacillus alkalisoli TaxID=1911548 RepID=A0A917LGZ8_9BACI|nr:aminoglycoside 6'-N-acetyltransferase [Lysinibacillus alkalisoli]GGG22574.1 N-acetyltransferase [Lysinibacillus alkalisoli]
MFRATAEHVEEVTQLAKKLWPDASLLTLTKEITHVIETDDNVVFLQVEGQQPVAFAHATLRTDYVEGTHSSPVGYLEGIYVEPEFRNQQIARQLVVACEQWAHNKGCTEFASDCELHNEISYHFHKALGFIEVNRIVCFTKKI